MQDSFTRAEGQAGRDYTGSTGMHQRFCPSTDTRGHAADVASIPPRAPDQGFAIGADCGTLRTLSSG